MKVSYDKKADAVYIEFSPLKADETLHFKEGVYIDINKGGKRRANK